MRHTKSEENLQGVESEATNNVPSEKSEQSQQQQPSPIARQTPIRTGCARSPDMTFHFIDDDPNDCWSQEDDEITQQYLQLHKSKDKDTISEMSQESSDSRERVFVPGDVRRRIVEAANAPKTTYRHDPEDPSAAVLKEPWEEKQKRIRNASPYGHLASWRLLAVIVKCGDDLRQELLASQLLTMLQKVWQEEQLPLWLRPYK